MPAKTTSTQSTKRSTRRRKSPAKLTTIPSKSEAVVVKEEAKVAPPAPKLTFEDYLEDFQSRVKVHNYEFNLFVKDVQKGYTIVLDFSRKTVSYVKDSYERAFDSKTA